MRRRDFSDWELRRLKEMRLGGSTWVDIGEMLGRGSNVCYCKGIDLGLVKPKAKSEVSWTDDRVELLKKLWAEGLSASQIAGQLGGVTRNAVIGKVHRLGLSGRATTSRVKSSPKPKAKSNKSLRFAFGLVSGSSVLGMPLLPKEVIYNGLRQPPKPHQLTDFTNLKEGQCKFIHGDPEENKEWGYCGKPTDPGASYCRECKGVVTHKREVA